MAIFHYTVKIVGRSKGKSVISASAYLNGDVMKNEESRLLIIGIGYQVGKIYRKYCWDIISIMVTITSTAIL